MPPNPLHKQIEDQQKVIRVFEFLGADERVKRERQPCRIDFDDNTDMTGRDEDFNLDESLAGEEASKMAASYRSDALPPEIEPETLPGDPWYLDPPLNICPVGLRKFCTPKDWENDERESLEQMRRDRERYKNDPETLPGDPWYLPEKNLICPMVFREYFTPEEWEAGARAETQPIGPGETWLDYAMYLEPEIWEDEEADEGVDEAK